MDTLALANKITKALYPDTYGKPGITLQQGVVLIGTRDIIESVLKEELCPDAGAEPVTLVQDGGGA